MNFDRWLGILGLLTGAVGIWLAYYFYIKTIRAKVLAIAYTQPISLLLPIEDVPDNYLAHTNDPSRVFVLFWNRGTAPIEEEDFIDPIMVRPTDRILRIVVHEKDPAAAATIDEVEGRISINLLRPGEAIILRIDVAEEGYTPDIAVQMKSADMSVLLRSEPFGIRDVLPIVATLAIASLFFGTVWLSLDGETGKDKSYGVPFRCRSSCRVC